METDPFRKAVDRLLGHEGGYVFHPRDPGGETKWGISKRSYPDLDIKNLSREYAISLYKLDFWIPLNCDDLPFPLAFQVFDAGVNHGRHRVQLWLAEAQKEPSTLAAVVRFNVLRLRFYTGLKTFNAFGKGWTARVQANLEYGLHDCSTPA